MYDLENAMYDDDPEIIEFLRRCYHDPVLFAESFLRNDAGELYTLEPHQKEFLMDDAKNRILFFGRRMGKTESLAIDSLHKCVFTPNYSVFVITPFASQAERFSETLSDIIHRSEGIADLFSKDILKKKKLTNRSQIQMATAGKDNVTGVIGAKTNYLIIDESQDVPDVLYSKIRPILRGQVLGKPHIVFSGTPRGRQGFFYNSINNAYRIFESDKTIRNDSGMYSLHRKPTAFIDENNNIIGTGTPRITIEELEEEKVSLSMLEFKAEYCLSFLDTLGKVFPNKLIEECESDEPLQFGSRKPCVGGLDFGKINNNSVLFIGELDKNRFLDIKYIHEFPLDTTYTGVANYMKETIPKHYPRLLKVCADMTGVGQAVLEHFSNFTKYEVEGFTFSQKSKIEVVEDAVATMESNSVIYPHNPRFKKEMNDYMRELGKNNIVKYVKGESDDYVDAYLMCVRAAHNTNIPVEPQVIQVGSNLLDQKISNNKQKQFRSKKPNNDLHRLRKTIRNRGKIV